MVQGYDASNSSMRQNYAFYETGSFQTVSVRQGLHIYPRQICLTSWGLLKEKIYMWKPSKHRGPQKIFLRDFNYSSGMLQRVFDNLNIASSCPRVTIQQLVRRDTVSQRPRHVLTTFHDNQHINSGPTAKYRALRHRITLNYNSTLEGFLLKCTLT
jgi:hypothetical protein